MRSHSPQHVYCVPSHLVLTRVPQAPPPPMTTCSVRVARAPFHARSCMLPPAHLPHSYPNSLSPPTCTLAAPSASTHSDNESDCVCTPAHTCLPHPGTGNGLWNCKSVLAFDPMCDFNVRRSQPRGNQFENEGTYYNFTNSSAPFFFAAHSMDKSSV